MKWIEKNNEVIIRDENNMLQLNKDKEALELYLEESVKPRMMKFNSYEEKINYLIKNDYYASEVLENYTMDEILCIRMNAENVGFRFQSYMSANKFYEGYALKTNDGNYILENYEDKVTIVALTLAGGEFKLAKDLVISMARQEFQPATPTFLNAGRSRAGEMVSCFLLNIEDSSDGISYAVGASNHLSKIGGGVANFWSL